MAKVLVVEDETNVRKLVSVNLSGRGHQLFEAKDGAQALAELHAHPPALMVLDIKLPDVTGWDLLDKISKDTTIKGDFPVLVITASITDAYLDRGRYPPVTEILIKPFSTTELLSAVDRALKTGQKKESELRNGTHSGRR
jgi:CheY-like chemotaxis protein